MGCIFSHVQVLFSKSDNERDSPSMLGHKSRSKEVLLHSQASTILTPSKQRGGGSSRVPYTSLEEAGGEEITIQDAVRRQDKESLLRLINSGSVHMDPFGIQNNKGSGKTNPVELACKLGFTEIVEIFLDNGCSPNFPTSQGRLIHSVLDGMKSSVISLECGRRLIQLLCDRGCDVNVRDSHYNSTLLYAAELGDSSILDTIAKRSSQSQFTHRCGGSRYTPLHMSAMRGDADCVQILLTYTPSLQVNILDSKGNTPLLLALKSMYNILEYLNSAKTEMSSQNSNWIKERERLLKYQHCSVSIVEQLLLAGAEVKMSNVCHFCHHNCVSSTPLCYAMHLCTMDETNGFEDDSDINSFTDTMNLVSTEKIQNLEKWSVSTSDVSSSTSATSEKFSVYSGVVRLIVLSGAELDDVEKLKFSKYPSVVPLLDEITEFWTTYQQSKPPKLMHMAKQVVRNHLASLQSLHKLNMLPLPERLKEYVKLNCL